MLCVDFTHKEAFFCDGFELHAEIHGRHKGDQELVVFLDCDILISHSGAISVKHIFLCGQVHVFRPFFGRQRNELAQILSSLEECFRVLMVVRRRTEAGGVIAIVGVI